MNTESASDPILQPVPLRAADRIGIASEARGQRRLYVDCVCKCPPANTASSEYLMDLPRDYLGGHRSLPLSLKTLRFVFSNRKKRAGTFFRA